jgi:hypothetical protein
MDRRRGTEEARGFAELAAHQNPAKRLSGQPGGDLRIEAGPIEPLMCLHGNRVQEGACVAGQPIG